MSNSSGERARWWLENAHRTGIIRWCRVNACGCYGTLEVCFANGNTRKEDGMRLAEALGKIVPGWESEVPNLDTLDIGAGI